MFIFVYNKKVMKLRSQLDDICKIGFAKPTSWYDWVGYRMYVNIRRVNNKPVKVENHFYTADGDNYIGFELDDGDKIFWI